MPTEEITIRVDPEAARVYKTASEEERQRLDALLSQRLREAIRGGDDLEQYMRDVSRRAQARGLTPEILRELLNEQ